MAVETRTQIKTYFETGDIPTEAQFINAWDSCRFQEDGIDVSAEFSGDGTTASPLTLAKATVQASLSVDDLIALSGVADGATNLGTFTGTTIADSQTIKQALQALETAVEAAGGTSAAGDNLTSGTVTARVLRNGGTATTISNPAAGEYDLDIKVGAFFRGADVFGNNTTLNGSSEFIVRIDNGANSQTVWPNIQVYDVNTGALVDMFASSINPTLSIALGVTTITFPGMNLFGATGFQIIIR